MVLTCEVVEEFIFVAVLKYENILCEAVVDIRAGCCKLN
jgi:hypothetical protein